MVRPTGGRGTSRGVSRPSAQEMLRSITSNVFGDEFSGVPVTATKAEFKNIKLIVFQDVIDSGKSLVELP